MKIPSFVLSLGAAALASCSSGASGDTAPSPAGPWKYRGCILESDAKHQGPGHHSFVENPATKEWFIVYHRWETARKAAPFRGGRKIAVEKIGYDEQGLIRPVVMTDGKSPASPIRR